MKRQNVGRKWGSQGGAGQIFSVLWGGGRSGGKGGIQNPYIYNTVENSKYLFFHVIILFEGITTISRNY
jgi:hypothetical protein